MSINAGKPERWKADISASIDYYNDWFLRFAPQTYREQRILRTHEVNLAFKKTNNLRILTPEILKKSPELLPVLRMTSAPPLARDRLMGLAYASKTLINAMEGKANVPSKIPPRIPSGELNEQLLRISDVLLELLDHDLFPWITSKSKPSKGELERAAAVIADRLCGAASDPIIRNAQEKRQLQALQHWLKKRGYKQLDIGKSATALTMPSGTYSIRMNVPVGTESVPINLPIDCVVQPHGSRIGAMPLLIEAKSAGDSTNTNKRRKEEAQKASQLRIKYGEQTQLLLFLCGYFETGYLGYEAAEGLDWIWEHRLDDLDELVPPSANTSKKKRSPHGR